jgi:NADPH:quinone reductase-like Zn-dependent oxidoreductase
MRVLVWKGPWDLTVETRDDPRPGPGAVLVRVAATGICGSDVHASTCGVHIAGRRLLRAEQGSGPPAGVPAEMSV